MTSNKLLSKSSRALLLFSVILLVIAGPVVYVMTNRLYLEEVDQTLLLLKLEFEQNEGTFKSAEIPQWNKYNKNAKIYPPGDLKKDTLFSVVYFDKMEKEDEPYRELNAPVIIDGKPYIYMARINLIEKRNLALGVAILFTAVIILLLAGIFLLNKYLSQKIWKPFYDTLRQIEAFEIDKDLVPSFLPTKIEEFSRLNKSLGNLIEKNIAIYKNQREFVENAAHELQTPLALFQGRIDNLMQMQLTREQAEILEALNADVGRLNRLNKNLLLLSKIEKDHFFKTEHVSVNEHAEKILPFFKEQASGRGLSVTYRNDGILAINSNPVLVEVLLNNLFQNAIRHSAANGKIMVTIDERRVTFKNSGVSELNIERLFNRFAKVASSTKGNGLGLAIIRKITELNQWGMHYTFVDGFHIFVIDFTPGDQ